MENLPVMIDLESVAAIDDTGEVLIIVVCRGASVGDIPDPMTCFDYKTMKVYVCACGINSNYCRR